MTTVPHEQELELYHYPESLCSQMVRIALAEKGYEWKSHPIFLEEVTLNGDNLSDAYLAINPKGQVPTLVHNGTPVFESYDIIRYLDRLDPDRGTRLIPGDPALDEQVRGWVLQSSMRDDVRFGKSLGMSIPILSSPIIKACINRQPMAHLMRKFRRHPVFSRRIGFLMLRMLPFVPKPVFRNSVKSVSQALASIERTLEDSGGPYLLGEFTQVDVMMMAHFHRLEDVALEQILDWDGLPRIRDYWQRLRERPSYRTAVTDWHEENWRRAIQEVFSGKPSDKLSALKKRVSALR